MDVILLETGSATIHYEMEFQNSPNGHAIDVVDIGMPNEHYGLNEVSASSGGVRLTDIRQSQYVHPGVEVHLDQQTIPAGQSGNFTFEATVGELVYQDTTRKDYASLKMTPTWFGDKYVVGTTDLTVRIHLPQGVREEEVVYQNRPFTGKATENGKVVVSWQESMHFTGPYMVGVSFAKRVMTHVIKMTINELLARWYLGATSQQTRTFLVIAALVVLGIIFFRFSGGTGCVLFGILAVIALVFFVTSVLTQIYIWPILLVLGVVVEKARRKRKQKYLPAIATVEGGGIKRGLTAPEAAVLLELPLNKIVTLILFGMMKKGLIRQTNKAPISFTIEENRPADAILQPYENEVLLLLPKNGNVPLHQLDFSNIVERLVKSAAQKMTGFDLDQTREYYRQIISRAWVEAKAIGDVETWQKKMDEKIDWMMLDPGFDDRFRPYNTRYIPRSYRSFPNISVGGSQERSPAPTPGSAPRFSDVAASVSGWFQNSAQGVVAKVEGAKGGVMNFGSVDRALASAMKSSGSRSGGGGGGCACACAGCACACACAGGGR